MKFIILLVFIICLWGACKKANNGEDELPLATQTGAGTFGCKINGKVFVPKGFDGTGRPNPHIQYDFDLQGQPYLSIQASQFASGTGNGGVDIGFNEINSIGYYNIGNLFSIAFGWSNEIGNCGSASWYNNVYYQGGGIITKLDINNRIISGTFECKFKRPDCDTTKITDGRFDIKF
jgi:hypothetical protein